LANQIHAALGEKLPKKKIEGEPIYPQLRTFEFPDFDGDSVVKVWCEGRDYDPKTEAYKPRYSYSIITEKWRYDGNDISGGPNELPNLDKASQSLFAFLYASQESYKIHIRGAFTDGNFEMFPPHVNEWAVQNSEEISTYSIACEMKAQQS
jgi:hypothetical protein